jgi:hypothetical protein
MSFCDLIRLHFSGNDCERFSEPSRMFDEIFPIQLTTDCHLNDIFTVLIYMRIRIQKIKNRKSQVGVVSSQDMQPRFCHGIDNPSDNLVIELQDIIPFGLNRLIVLWFSVERLAFEARAKAEAKAKAKANRMVMCSWILILIGFPEMSEQCQQINKRKSRKYFDFRR